MSRRQLRVEDLLRSEISAILRTEVADPRARLASVSRVHVSADLGRAEVFVSVLSAVEADTLEPALQHAAGFIRKRLATRLKSMKRIPLLVFHADHGAEHSQYIEDLLQEMKHERSDP